MGCFKEIYTESIGDFETVSSEAAKEKAFAHSLSLQDIADLVVFELDEYSLKLFEQPVDWRKERLSSHGAGWKYLPR